MTIPQWTLLGFALWTLLVLLGTVGTYRWTRILTGAVEIQAFRADAVSGHADWYRRALRAHANCVENLPVFGALIVLESLVGKSGPIFGILSVTFLAARVCQTLVHVSFSETARTVSLRFTFFLVQVICMFWMAARIAVTAGASS